MTDTVLSSDAITPEPVARPAGRRWQDLTLGERHALRRMSEFEEEYNRRVLRELETVRAVAMEGDEVRAYRNARRYAERAAADLAAADALLDTLLAGRQEVTTDEDAAGLAKAVTAATLARDDLSLSAAACRTRAAELRAGAEGVLAAAVGRRLDMLQNARVGDNVLRAVDPRKVNEVCRLD